MACLRILLIFLPLLFFFRGEARASSPGCIAQVREQLVAADGSTEAIEFQLRKFFDQAVVPIPPDPLLDVGKPGGAQALYQPHPIGEGLVLWSSGKPDSGYVAGTSRFPGIRGAFFVNQRPELAQVELAVFLDALRQGYLNRLAPDQAGLGLHMVGSEGKNATYLAIRADRLLSPEFARNAPAAYLNLPADYRAFVDAQYAARLPLSPQTRARLVSISEQVEGRSILVVKTKESFVGTDGNRIQIYGREADQAPPQVDPAEDQRFHDDMRSLAGMAGKEYHPAPFSPLRIEGRKMPEHFTLEGGAVAVYSTSAGELLPLEILTGQRVARVPGKLVVEAGRYAVSKKQVAQVSPKIIQQIAAVAEGIGEVGKIVIEADVAHRRLYTKYGFRVVKTFRNAAGETEYVMEVDPKKLLFETIKRDSVPGPSRSLDFVLDPSGT